MATYTNINDTRADLSVSITPADLANAETGLLADAMWAVDTLIYDQPSNYYYDSGYVYLGYSDGTDVWVGGTVSGSVATATSLYLSNWSGFNLSAEGSVKINLDTGSVAGKFTELHIENDSYGFTYKGSVGVTANGSFSGSVSSMQFTRTTLDPAVWEAIIFTGTAKVDASGSLAGTITGVEVGFYDVDYSTPTAEDDHTLTWNSLGKATGLKVSTSSLESMSSYDSLFALNLSGNDKLTGTAGDDYIDGGAGNDQIDGLAGNDDIYGGAGNDKLTDLLGDNYLDGGEGNNSITSGAGNDVIFAGAGNDKIVAGDGVNVIDAGNGNNNITTGSGDDTIVAGAGNDKIAAGDGENFIDAGVGNDTITTGAGDDVIFGDAGNDKITAGAGNDWIFGGVGADKISGGLGSDHFVFDNLGVGGFDTLSDFSAVDDMLMFDAAVFTSLSDGVTADNLCFGAAAQDEDDYLIFNAKGGKLYYDADGNGSGAAVQIAVLKGSVAGLNEANFALLDV